MKKVLVSIGFVISTMLIGCSSLQLQPADFSWPADEIAEIGPKGMTTVKDYSNFVFNIAPLLAKEFAADSMLAKSVKEVHIICDKAGYYYVTGKKFKNVYVLEQSEGALSLKNTLIISADKSLEEPVFDQNESFILLHNKNEKFQLTKGGVQPAGGKR